MTKPADLRFWIGAHYKGPVGEFSPDGQKVVVVLRKGDVQRNTNEYSLLLWHLSNSGPIGNPETLATMSSSSNRSAIGKLKWSSDSRTVYFVGENTGQQGQVYSVTLSTHGPKKLSDSTDPIVGFSTTPDGSQIAYLAETAFESLWSAKTAHDGFVISTQHPFMLLTGKDGDPFTRENRLYFQSSEGKTVHLKTLGKIKTDPLLAPNGKYVLLQTYADSYPINWWKYSNNPDLQRALNEKRRAGQYTWITRYELVDTDGGQSRILLDVPQKSWETDAAWSPDSRSIVISNTYLPLDGVDQTGLAHRRTARFAVEVDVSTGRITPITEESLKLVGWVADKNEVIFEGQNSGVKAFVKDKEGQWGTTESARSRVSHAEVVVDEDMSTPPKLFLVDHITGKRTLLRDLNPQFTRLQFGKIEEIRWKDREGREITAGLYYPVGFEPGKKYPLVIQTHEWDAKKFWIDGPWTTAFAAQPLAGKGIIVLQAERHLGDPLAWWTANGNTPREVDRDVAAYESAIDYLDSRGLIDTTRIGIVGFSRTCLYVKSALVRSKYRFVAASVTDGVDGGYLQYLTWGTSVPKFASDFEGINDGQPFGPGLIAWMQRAPGFNIDKVHTPVRIVALSPMIALFEWEWFAGLSRLGKPVEMVMMRDGVHILERPSDRMVSQQGNVDWFDFWLNGHEDPDPAKAEQYARWRDLKKLQEANQSPSRK